MVIIPMVSWCIHDAPSGADNATTHTHINVVTTKKESTMRFNGSRMNRSVIRWLYRVAASSTMMATTVTAMPSTPAITSAEFATASNMSQKLIRDP